MFEFLTRDKELEIILQKLYMNASNNYKDAAQTDFTEFKEVMADKKASGKLTGKKLAYYEQILEKLTITMDHYTHKDQKADFSGLMK